MTEAVIPVPASREDYEKSNPEDVSFALLSPADPQRNHVLFRDNREKLKNLLGPKHFGFRSEFVYDCWRVNFADREYFILSAAGKGTCYERSFESGLEIATIDRRFLQEMTNLLSD